MSVRILISIPLTEAQMVVDIERPLHLPKPRYLPQELYADWQDLAWNIQLSRAGVTAARSHIPSAKDRDIDELVRGIVPYLRPYGGRNCAGLTKLGALRDVQSRHKAWFRQHHVVPFNDDQMTKGLPVYIKWGNSVIRGQAGREADDRSEVGEYARNLGQSLT